jgi:hypothetical protein
MSSIAKSQLNLWSFRARRRWAAPSLTLAFLVGCGAAAPGEPDDLEDGEASQAAAQPEDGLAEAYSTFLETFVNSGLDSPYPLGFGFHPGMNTEKVLSLSGRPLNGQVQLDMNRGTVTAFLDAPSSGNFDLWFVRNVPGAGKSALPEAGDEFFKVGRFESGEGFRSLEADIGFNINFDLDLVVITRANKTPAQSRLAVGERTILEKRLFRFRQNQGLDPVTGALAHDIETTDPLVARGAELFFNETFGGNGRTCGTCHRAENNLTIDPAFIATLPEDDPLFVAENNPALAGLENPELLRTRGLILENVDGFESPTEKFVMRGVPHTLSMSLTNGIGNVFNGSPPDHRLGWSGDGGPGRSTLQQFAFGAIMQHFTKSLQRRAGIDFRLPTQEELDALEAFQLFTGRQKPVDFAQRVPTDPRAAVGSSLFFGVGCTSCHSDLFGFVNGFEQNFDTGTRNLTPDLVFDDGFGTPGDLTFNVPPLAEAADTPPLFHNNSAPTIEDGVAFYFSQTFRESPSAFFIFGDPTVEEQGDIAAFLRVVNASFNLSQVRKRAEYVRTHRSPGNTDLLGIALADARDARVVLADQNLNAEVRTQIRDAEQILRNARGQADNRRAAAMRRAVALLDQAEAGLFSEAPNNGGEGGIGGGPGTGGMGVGGSFAGAGGFESGGTGMGASGGTESGGTGGFDSGGSSMGASGGSDAGGSAGTMSMGTGGAPGGFGGSAG